ncbi:MAG: cytochrome P450 [Chloroflexota bacterium]|nr:cytochrome P450 [Chloroflexota bacterium]
MSAHASAPSHPLPPGSFGLPVLGETIQFISNPGYLAERFAQYDTPIVRTHILFKPTAVMRGAEATRFILQTGFDHFTWGDGWPITFREILGQSLFLQDGAEHRQKRRLLMPAFHREALRNYLSVMETTTRRYLARWEAMGEFAWFIENKQLTFEIASTLLMGTTHDDQSQIASLSRDFTALTAGLTSLPANLPFAPYGKALRARDRILAHIESAIAARQVNPTHDALSLLIQTRDEDGNALDPIELKAQALLLLFAGHETTTSMITSFCMAMAQHPDVWARAREEQLALNLGDDLQFDDFKAMPYLEQILKEVERMYAPVAGGFRGVVKPFEFGGYHVPAGWRVLYNIPAAHHDPAIYSEPSRFDPDRFSSARAEGSRTPFSLVGFGGGARVCIGYAFAQLEMKVVASYLLRFHTWELLPGQDLGFRTQPTLHPIDGLRVRFSRRA